MPNYFVRVVKMLIGLLLCALGVVMTIKSNLGLSPWEVFHQGLSFQIGISIGIASIIVGALVVCISFLGGEKFGFGTLGSVVMVGTFVDLFLFFDLIPAVSGMHWKVTLLLGGLFCLALSTYCYLSAGLGAGPRDTLMVLLVKKTKLPVGLIRTGVEGTAVLLGWLMGGQAGAGTVLAAFGVGILVQAIFKFFNFNVNKVPQESIIDTIKILKNSRAPEEPQIT